MKFYLLVTFTITLVMSLDALLRVDEAWEAYKVRFNKTYVSYSDETYRYGIWLNNHATVEEHNAETDKPFTMDDNELSDRTEDEIKARLGAVVPAKVAPILVGIATLQQVLSPIPSQIDWRSSFCMPAVKDQGPCGSSYAFAATTPLEFLTCKRAALRQETSPARVLSESQLVNCSFPQGNYGCNGGFYTNAWDYVKVAPGQASAVHLPYYPADSTECGYNANTMKSATLTSYVQIRAKDTAQIMQSVANYGPLAAAMTVLPDTFTFYRSGVYSDPACPNTGTDFNHAVVLVGYGTSNGIDYWVVRNSWGATWGDHGYILIQRGVNMCNIESLVYYINI